MKKIDQHIPLKDVFVIDNELIINPKGNEISVVSKLERKISLEPRLMEVLLILCQQPNEIIEKKLLLERVWGNQYASDEVVVLAISRLRKAIKSIGVSHQIIKTFPKKGYAFLGAIQLQTAENIVEQGRQKNKVNRSFQVAIFGVLLLVIVASVWYLSGARESQVLVPYSVEFLTHEKGLELTPEFSPDGQQLLYASRENDELYSNVLLKDLTTGTIKNLSSNLLGNCTEPIWGPGKDALLFLYQDTNALSIKYQSLSSGSLNTLVQSNRATTMRFAMSLDERYLAIIYKYGQDSAQLFRYDFKTGQNKYLRSFSYVSGRPSFRPQTQMIGIIDQTVDGRKSRIQLLDLAQNKIEAAYEIDQEINNLTWKNADKLLLTDSYGRLYEYALKNESIAHLGPSFLSNIKYSPTQRSLVAIQRQIDINIWALNLKTKDNNPLINSTRAEWGPSISPNGKFVSFFRELNHAIHFIVKNLETEEEIILDTLEFNQISDQVAWSYNNQMVASLINEGNEQLLQIYNLGKEHRKIALRANGRKLMKWDSLGKRIYLFNHQKESSKIEILDIEREETNEILELPRDVVYARNDEKNQKVFFVTKEHFLKSMDLQNGAVDTVLVKLNELDISNWIVSGQKVYFVSRGKSYPTIKAIDIPTRVVNTILELKTEQPMYQVKFSIDRDERFLVYYSVDKVETEVVRINM